MNITITEGQIPYYGSETNLKVKVYARRRFVTSDNQVILKGTLGTDEHIAESDATVVGNVATYLSFDIPSTEDGTPNSSYYTIGLYTTSGDLVSILHTKLRVPSSPTVRTLESLADYNAASCEDLPNTYYTARQIDELLEDLLGSTQLATTANFGIVKLNFPAADIDEPIVPSMNWPAMRVLSSLKYLEEYGDDLAAAIADIGSDPVELIISSRVHDEITSAYLTSGTLAEDGVYGIQDYRGAIKDLELLDGGTGYSVGAGLDLTSNSLEGTGATIEITFVSGGVVTGYLLEDGGTNFRVGDLVTIDAGGEDCIFEVKSLVGTDQLQNVGWTAGYNDSGLDYRYFNAIGTVFRATGTTPTTWSDGTSIRQFLEVPGNIRLRFIGNGSLKASGGGGIFINSMVDPGDVKVFETDGEGEILVHPGAVMEHKLTWWTGPSSVLTGSEDSAHELGQLRTSLSFERLGGVARIPTGIFGTSREIEWTSHVHVIGNGWNQDRLYGTAIKPIYDVADDHPYRGLFKIQQRAQNISFSELCLDTADLETWSAFKNVLDLSGCYNISFTRVHFTNSSEGDSKYLTVFDGTGSWHEFINYYFDRCTWTCQTNTNAIYWRSTNSGGQFNLPQFRCGAGSTAVDAPASGFITIVNPDWRGNAAYDVSPDPHRTIAAAASITNNTTILTLTESFDDGEFFTKEDIGRYVVNVAALPAPGTPTGQYYYIRRRITPWSVELGGGPDGDGTAAAGLVNADIQIIEPGIVVDDIAEACVHLGTHVNFSIEGGADEGFQYFVKDGAADFRDELNLRGCFVQGLMLFDGGSSTLNAYGCDFYSRSFIVNASPIIRIFGGTFRRYIVQCEQARYPYPFMELSVAEPFREEGNFIEFAFDSSYKDCDAGFEDEAVKQANIMGEPLTIFDRQRAGHIGNDEPLLTIISSSTNEVTYKSLLRLATAYYTTRIPRFWYDFSWAPGGTYPGFLDIAGNQGAPYVGMHINGSFVADGYVKSTDPVEGLGYGTGAGDAVTQGTSKSTGVTLTGCSGTITTHNESMADGEIKEFFVTNSSARTYDTLAIGHISGGTLGAYKVDWYGMIALNGFYVRIENISGGPLGEALDIHFNIIRGVQA